MHARSRRCIWCETEQPLEVCKECKRHGLHRFGPQEAELVKAGSPEADPRAVAAEARRWSTKLPPPVKWREATFVEPAREEESKRWRGRHEQKDRRL